jgi:hypothetical protein
MSFIYLIWQDKTSFYKIGKADKPRKRLKDLQTGHSNKLYLIAEMECKDPLRKELFLHHKYGQHRTNGEWFSFPPTMLHKVFAEFEFHVEETPDECIHYWVSVATQWEQAAKKLMSRLKSVHSKFFEQDAYMSLVDKASHELLLELIKLCPYELSEASLDEHRRYIAEVKLISEQIGISV